MSDYGGYRRSFPVFRATLHRDGRFEYKGLLGTGFAIGGDYMITAGHVAAEIKISVVECAAIGLTSPDHGWVGAPVIEIDALPNDLALLKVKYLSASHLDLFDQHKWSRSHLPALEDVHSPGFAYGDYEILGYTFGVQRAFKGYVVCDLPGWRRPGAEETPFPVYELSFAAPRGLSGSPLLNSDTTPSVCGVVIGNSETRMQVHHSTESEAGTNETITVDRYEMLTLGIAVRSDAILRLESPMLGSTIEEHLERHGLLTEAERD